MSGRSNNSDNWRETTCIHCLSRFSDAHVAVLTLFTLLGLSLIGLVVWLRPSSQRVEKIDLLSYNLLFSIVLISMSFLSMAFGIHFFMQLAEFMWSFLLNLTMFANPLFHSLLCLERYLAVRHPVSFLKYRPLRYRLYVLASAWLSVIIIWTIHAALCATEERNITSFLIFQCYVLLQTVVIDLFCYVGILRVLIRPSPGDVCKKRVKSGREGGRSYKDGVKRKAFKLVACVQFFVVTCYMPPVFIILSSHAIVGRYFCFIYMYNITYIIIFSSFYSCYLLNNIGKFERINCLKNK